MNRSELKSLSVGTFKSGTSSTKASEVRSYEDELIDSVVNTDEDADVSGGYPKIRNNGKLNQAVMPDYYDSTKPSIAAGVGAGVSPTINISGTNKAGKVDITTGTGASGVSGELLSVSFVDLSFPNGCAVSLSSANQDTAALGLPSVLIVNGTQNGFKITNPNIGQLSDATLYSFYYLLEGF